MKHLKILLFLLIITSTGTLAFEEGIHLYRPNSKYITNTYSIPEYLTVEDLTFFTCIEEDTVVKSSVVCLDNNNFQDLEVSKWIGAPDNCYITGLNLDKFKCKHLRIQSEYIKNDENIKLTKEIRVNKFTSVLDKIVQTQYSDGGWLDSAGTVSGIWAMSYFKDIYDVELDKALDWLKLNRDNTLKCFPKSRCSTKLTSKILALLSLSDYNDTKRVINDGRNWLEKKQNYYEEGDEWNLTILDVADGTTLALVGYGGDILSENFTIPQNRSTSIPFKVETDKELVVISDENTYINITNAQGELVYEYQGDNITYNIPGPCWSPIRKGEVCDPTTTGYALFSPLPQKNKDRAIEWMKNHLVTSKLYGYYFGNDETDTIPTSLYLYNAYTDSSDDDEKDKVINWLLYKQNNEGSWGSGAVYKKLQPTGLAVLALLKSGFNRTAESIEDAEEWVSDNEDKINTSLTQELAMAFSILRNNARPLLTSRPNIIYITSNNYEFEIHNPTTFNLKDLTYKFSDNLKDYLEITTKQTISAYSYRKLKIKKIKGQDDNIYGYLSIKNKDDEIAKIPVVVSDFPTINVTTSDESVTVFGKSTTVTLNVKGLSKHTFICEILWDSADLTSSRFRITSAGKVPVKISFQKAQSKEDVYKGTLKCSAAGEEFTFPISYYMKRYSDKPFSITPKLIMINQTSGEVSFKIKNNLDQDIYPTLKFKENQNYFTTENELNIAPDKDMTVKILINIQTDINLTKTFNLDIETLGWKQTLKLNTNIRIEPKKQISPYFLLIVITIFIVLLAVAGYFIYRYRDKILEMINQKGLLKGFNSKKKIRTKIKKVVDLRKEDTNLAINNLVQILQFKGTKDEEITKRLLKEGFEPQEIHDALEKSGTSLEGIEELLIEKEKK